MSPAWTLLGLAVLATALQAVSDDRPLLTAEEIDAINAAGMWQADPALVEGKTMGSIRRNKARDWSEEQAPEYNWGELLKYAAIPATFDGRTQWPGCIHSIQNAGDCVGSWAISAADALSDRICVQKKQQAVLSPQYIINCQTNADGCDGGTAIEAWTYLQLSGAPTSICVPFVGYTGTCASKCTKTGTFALSKSSASNSYIGIQSMQAAIVQGGPIQSCFKMYSDFLSYKSGIYVQTSGSYVDIECVKLIGWGSSGGVNYWIGAGSFGTSWGTGGYFYFKMGQQTLGLETNGMAANPV